MSILSKNRFLYTIIKQTECKTMRAVKVRRKMILARHISPNSYVAGMPAKVICTIEVFIEETRKVSISIQRA